jgi:serine/threonine-protein kinase
VKVLDFGIALGVHGEGPSADDGGMIFGTPEYMPPEQARGLEVDARADLYAAGAILYELLTGRVPFSGSDPNETLALMLTRPPAPPSALVPGIPPELDALVLSALAKQPARRPQTAREFLTALSPFAGSPELRSILPSAESEAPLPLVTERPAAPSLRAVQRLELVLDSNPPPLHPLLPRTGRKH